MPVTGSQYDKMVKKASPGSPKLKNSALAFLTGGLICLIGQILNNWLIAMGFDENQAKTSVPVALIAASAVLTALGVYDKIARHAGAGTIVPITGFANSMVSPAIEFQSEGRILGTAARMFGIAGPVIVYGISASVLYGLIIWIFKIF